MTDLAFMSAIELKDLIVRKQASPVEVAMAALARAEASQASINAFVTLTPELALAAARKVEQAIMAGKPPGLLAGLPLSVKDLTAVAGVKLTFGSRVFADNVATVDAPAVERIKAHGAIIVGKSTTTELGCKGSSTSPVSGATRNPWDLSRTTGGSSSGAAASVAAGVTPFSLATDGGGSIRIPGAFCGLFGIKAQFGRVPVYPVAATPTLSHVGPLARTVRDAALLLQAMAGFDARDAHAVAGPVPDFMAACEQPAKGLRIAWSPTLGYVQPDPEVVELCRGAVAAIEGLGCRVEEVAHVFDDPAPAWFAEFYAGAGTRMKNVLKETPELLDPAVRRLLEPALEQSIDGYFARVFERYEFRQNVRKFFERFDLLVMPTLPTTAFPVERDAPENATARDPVSWVGYTYPFNLTGQPAATIPCGLTRAGLPVGLQIVAPALAETDIFRLAAALEQARPWAHLRPPTTAA